MDDLDVFPEFSRGFCFFPTQGTLVLFGSRVKADHGVQVDACTVICKVCKYVKFLLCSKL